MSFHQNQFRKRAPQGRRCRQKHEVMGYLDRTGEKYGQHMPHIAATHLYLGNKKVGFKA